MTTLPPPTPAELREHPELASLELLEHSAELAIYALLAVYPELDDPERPYWLPNPPPLCRDAAHIVHIIAALRSSLARYRDATGQRYDLPSDF